MKRETSLSEIPVYILIEYWAEFIDSCEDGYIWDYSEYHHEIVKRDLIQIQFEGNRIDCWLLEKLNALDKRFSKLLQDGVTLPNKKYWWNKGVLKEAGDAYCDYMLTGFNIQVINV